MTVTHTHTKNWWNNRSDYISSPLKTCEYIRDPVSNCGHLTFVFEKKTFFLLSKYPLLKMDTSNTDDMKLDPDHHEKIASLIPQVTLVLEVWQQLSIGK